jgi:two-component SAPR family response regulator
MVKNRAIEFYNKGIEADELVEKFYRHLMLCYKKMGDKNEALRVYKRCKTVLSAGFGIEPSHETEEVYKSLLTG